MAIVKIAAGAELDLATGDELKGATNSILSALPGDEPRPIYLTRVDTTVSTGGVVQLDLGAPPVGSIWQIRFVTMFGNDESTVVGGITGALFCGDPANLSFAQLRVPGMAIPSLTFIPDTCMWCHPNEDLVIKTSAVVTSGQQIGAVVGIEEWRQRDVSRLGGKP